MAWGFAETGRDDEVFNYCKNYSLDDSKDVE